ncbi:MULTISPECIES: hypothetical protein [Streptomyces]|uniref:hypothetical protein n=1 Tax=Streptomyces TaxID=1883 RepID=UPI00143E1F16|nr:MULTISPECIES: hypothetical protein [Streptomyces]MCL7493671.1 hypothetical protein [Streptomyces sp. MCA2]MCX4635603.1 hypothetical protein [Streptomyces platensis]QIY58739.1 hypothetical protein HEP86_35005 [Streptomyces sp. RPA4-5]WJY42007.1 hypothetical protein QT196_34800 [Streptomyces sp. P9-2B-2]WSK33576.1 hypothetical protein OG761_04445 [Streptomyces tubercidicus]
MRKKLSKAAVVLAGIAAATTISMGAAQAADYRGFPTQKACMDKGAALTDNGHTAGYMCTEQSDGWLLEVGND